MSILSQKKYTEIKFDTKIFHKLVKLKIFKEDDRIELIEGRIYKMVPIGLKHMAVVNRITYFFSKFSGKDFIISIQNPLKVDEYNELYPDITIFRYREDFYINTYPEADKDVLLIIEVADTSLDYDREKKIPLYAKAKVPEVWIINLLEDIIEIYQQPDEERKEYTLVQKRKKGEISPLRLKDIKFKIEEIFIK